MYSALAFVPGVIDRATQCTTKAPMTLVHSEYSALIRLAINGQKSHGLKGAEVTSVRDAVAELEREGVEMFPDHCDDGRFAMKWYQMDPLTRSVGSFGSMKLLNVSFLERYSVHVKRVYHHTTQRLSSSTAATVRVMNQGMEDSATVSTVSVSTV